MSEMTRSNPVRWLALVGIALFLTAPAMATLVVVDKDGQTSDYPGWPLLYFGWVAAVGVLNGRIDGLGWLANPLWLLGTIRILSGRQRFTTILFLAAALVSLSGFALNEVLRDEGGNTAKVVGYRPGFWLWLASFWYSLVVSIFIDALAAGKTRQESEGA